MKITAQLLKRLGPNAPAARLRAMEMAAPRVLNKYDITSPNDLQMFFATLAHESGGFRIVVENSNYSAKNLGDMWGRNNWRRYFGSRAEMVAMAGKGQQLFNIVYGNRMGNGPASSGDGYRYRGRGLAQITGKDGYAQIEKITGLPLVQVPDLATRDENLLEIAGAFWKWKNLGPIADRGDFTAFTKKWNGGTIGMADRQKKLAIAKQIFTERLDPYTPPDQTPQKVVLQPVPPPETPHYPDYDPQLILAVKKELADLGYHEFGILDGEWGGRTVAAISAYKLDRGLSGAAVIDSDLLEQLEADKNSGWMRPVAEQRATAEVKDIADNKIVKSNWLGRSVAKITTWFSGVGAAVAGVASEFPEAKANYIDPAMGFFSSVPGWVWFGGGALIAATIWFSTRKTDQAAVEQFREGKLL